VIGNRGEARVIQQVRKGNTQAMSVRSTQRQRPLALWIAMALAAGGAMQLAHAGTTPPTLSSAWAAQRNNLPGNTPASAAPGTPSNLSAMTPGQMLQQRSVQQSIANLAAAAQGVAAQMAAQATAASGAAGKPSNVPNGLGKGGLQVASHIGTDPSLWQNADAPTQSSSGGQTTVTIKQTDQKAILNWDSFNVGRQTTVYFNQSAGNQSNGSNDWIALNRINDPGTAPSTILGHIKAEGTVYLLNRNGILFGAGSQVDTHSLLASSLDLFSSDVGKSNAFFLANGIGQTTDTNGLLGTPGVTVDFLVDGTGADGVTPKGGVVVEKGASIVSGAQGYALLAAPLIEQGGSIVADDGQVVLASGDTFAYKSASGTGSFSLAPDGTPPSGKQWAITNTGLIQARRGSIQWLGLDMSQQGVIVASTSLSHPGSLRFDPTTSNPQASNVEFGSTSVTTVLPEKDGETTSSSPTSNSTFVSSSVTVNTKAVLDSGALVEVPSGNVSFNVGTYVDGGAIIDVSGLADIELPMSALLVTIPRVGQNELADSPLLRNSFLYTQKNVVIDSTQSGTRDDGLDWVGSPVLNVAGYVDNVPRSIDELMTKGGAIIFAGQTIVRTGAQLRLEGGYVDYLAGLVSTPNLVDVNGLIYNIASADPNVDYVGFAGQYVSDHARWGISETYINPLLAGRGRWDPGFISGSDAGNLSFKPDVNNNVTTFVLDGDISAHAYAGREQVAQGTAPAGGGLTIQTLNLLTSLNGIGGNYVIQDQDIPLESFEPDFNASTPWPAGEGDPNDPGNPLYWRTLSTAMIDRSGLQRISLMTPGKVLLKDGTTLAVAPGGSVDITATDIDIEGTVRAPSGDITLTTVGIFAGPQQATGLLGKDGRLDASGLWVNDLGRAADNLTGREFIDGGSVSLLAWQGGGHRGADATADLVMQAGSVIDVSGGGYVGTDGLIAMDGTLPAGRGGDIDISTHILGSTNYQAIGAPGDLNGGAIVLDGSLLGYGFAGGGTLTIEAPRIQIGGEPEASDGIALLYLAPSFFEGQGFSAYKLISETDADIAPGTTINVHPLYRLASAAALLEAPTGLDLDSAGAAAYTSIGDVTPYQRFLSRTADTGFSLTTGVYKSWSFLIGGGAAFDQVSGSLTVGEGASIVTDPGSSVNLAAPTHLVVLGEIKAPGGNIALSNVGYQLENDPAGRSIWLGEHSVLDAAGTVLVDPLASAVVDAEGISVVPRTGVVLDGGTVSLSSDRDLAAQAGALIDVSGSDGTFDLPASGRSVGINGVSFAPTNVWSNAGSIFLDASVGLFFDGTIEAHAGAPMGRGGKLQIDALLPGSLSAAGVPTEIVLQQSGFLLPADATSDQTSDLDNGTSDRLLRFAVDRLAGSGIEDLQIGPTPDASGATGNERIVPLLFSGDVNIDLARSFVATAGSIGSVAGGVLGLPTTGPSTGAGHVSITAPYVSLTNPSQASTITTIQGDGSLDVHGDFIDLGGRLSLAGFADADFSSSGDIRFSTVADAYLAGAPLTGWLFSTGNLDFTATRVYPATGYRFLVDADGGSDAQGNARETTVAFHGNGNTDDSTPLSAGGTLVVAGTHIEQGGTLWVPSGALVLGIDDPASVADSLNLGQSFPLSVADSVHLAPGSVTSVSLGNAVLPYGTTADGKDWNYNGDPSTDSPAVSAPPSKQIAISGNDIALDAGATIDLSGGGHLQASEWVPGTGGSRDVLAQSSISYETSTAGVQVPQYADGRAIYAILPGYHAPLSAHDAALENGAGAGPDVGQGVYLSGIPGLPDGIYTLLPARYATLPGAYRVVQDTSAKDPIVGRNTVAPDGTNVVGGYFVDTLTGARDARSSLFDVQSAATWGQYSEYDLTSADTFFSNQAAQAGNIAPSLGADAGRLSIAASSALTLGASLATDNATGGRGSEVDIAGDAIQIVGAGEQARDGYLQIDATGLSTLGASSLLIGGKRSDSAEGEQVDVLANSVLLSNDAAHPLQGPEVILVANGNDDGVTIASGSVLRAVGAIDSDLSVPLVIGRTATDDQPAVSGDGALVRVSNGAPVPVTRFDVTGVDGPAGPSRGALTIDDGALMDGGLALSLDATGPTQVAAGATFLGKAIDVTASRIGIVADASGVSADSLLIGPNTLAQFAAADEVTLRSRTSIDFLGDVDLDVPNALNLSAASLHSDGGTVKITADTVILGNDLGTTAGALAAGSGSLTIDTGELDFAAGSSSLQGFGSFDAHADRGVVATGQGDFDFGALDVNFGAPRIAADINADMNLHTTGAFHLVNEGVAPTTARSLGGKLTIEAGMIDIGADIVAPGGDVSLTSTTGDLRIDDAAYVDVAGIAKPFDDIAAYLPGGNLTLDARSGNIVVAPGVMFDISGDAAGGNAGRLVVNAENGNAQLGGGLLGGANKSYLGGDFVLDTAGAIDLDGLADSLATSGINDLISVHTRSGDLLLDTGHTLAARTVDLTADGTDGGHVLVDGTVDSSGVTGGAINLNGAWGVDIEGALLTTASAAGERGGDIAIGTTGTDDGTLNATYGYENIQAGASGAIHIGANAHIDQAGPGGSGELALRAPLLSSGDINLTIDAGANLSRTNDVSVEAYAIWSTTDKQTDQTKHFDGIVDPAGWYDNSGQLVAGSWASLDGTPLSAPITSEQLTDYLSNDVFTPTTANLDHTSFYGNAGTDPGTLMGFIEKPGFTFESRLANVVNLQVRPGIELRNPDTSINSGDISLLTNWNLGAGLDQAALFYRYNGLAPFVTLRAVGDLNVRASLSDGFWQYAVVTGFGVSLPVSTLKIENDNWNSLSNEIMNDWGVDPSGILFAPEVLSGDSVAISQYYGLYDAYVSFLMTPGGNFLGPTYGAEIATIFAFGGLGSSELGEAPPPLPVNSAGDYLGYLSTYKSYFTKIESDFLLVNFAFPSNFAAPAPPPDTLIVSAPVIPVDNSPSPVRNANNPLPFAAATLNGGSSSSYRLVAGADMTSSDPLAVQAKALLGQGGNATGQVVLDGHTDYTDTLAGPGLVIHAPNLIRTGTGDIDIAAGGDIKWLDTAAPTAIYAAGAPADGTDTVQSANILRPSQSGLDQSNSPELVITGTVNPDNGGDVSLHAGGDIVGVQNLVDAAAGSATGLAGASTAQYWWQWMQTTNSADGSRSSIDFGGFDQGVMSVGGNVNIDAAGEIRQLSVSLPTTWVKSVDQNGVATLRVVGGGDLSVRAGGDILSGTYFVSRGQGTITAGGNIGADFNRTDTTGGNRSPELDATGTPVSTLLALQDAQVQVTAGGSIDIGGIYNPSYLDSGAVDALAPAGHADGQAYGVNSSISVQAARGDITYGSLISPLSLFASGMQSSLPGTTAGDVLPSTMNFIAANGSLDLLYSGELFPSATGNLNLLAANSLTFDKPSDQNLFFSWGLIDAPASLLPSALDPSELTSDATAFRGIIRSSGYLGLDTDPLNSSLLHEAAPLHANDDVPVRVYALTGDIVNGSGGGANGIFLVPSKPARIEAGRDIVDLAYLGQQTHASDISLISAGRDIRDTPLSLAASYIRSIEVLQGLQKQVVLPVIVQAGPGNLVVEAGRNIGTLSSQTELNSSSSPSSYQQFTATDGAALTGIDTVGNLFNPFLPTEGAGIQVLYGVGPGIDTKDFIARYIDPASNVPGVPSLSGDLVTFMENYESGLSVDTGLVVDKTTTTLTPDQAWQLFNALPGDAQTLFVKQGLFKILATVGQDYNDPASPFAGKYERGYDALNALFPASLGYTANGTSGGLNGAQTTVDTGDLDIRSSTIQTQQGGDIGILAPGGQALLGSVSAPPVILNNRGLVAAGPNTMGVLTLRTGDIDIFTDRSVLLAQSRIFTEQGGDLVMWSSNGDINAGKGAKTNTDIPPATYLCNTDAWCQQNPSGEVSGAGIATLQTIPDAPTGDIFLMAPRGTVDAGDAGIRFSGNLVVAALHVANADNIVGQGTKIGVPVAATVDIAALTSASAAAGAINKVANDLNRKQQSDARSNMPSIISVQVLGFGDGSASIDTGRPAGKIVYNPDSPVQVLGAGDLDGTRQSRLTVAERQRLLE
jgi:filamentous hemagglutinin family protein